MAIQICGKSPQLTLFFDRSSTRLSRSQIALLGKTLRDVDGVESVDMRSPWYRSQRITVVFSEQTEPNAILRKMAQALRSSTETILSECQTRIPAAQSDSAFHILPNQFRNGNEPAPQANQMRHLGQRAVYQRLRELGFGALTLGFFGLSWIGLFVPGIPTIPFVVLTAHFALQASPRLRNRLMQSKVFGQMMRDWQEHRAIRRSVQLQAYAFTTLIVIIGFMFSPPVPVFYAVMVAGSALGFYAVSMIPVLEQQDAHRLQPVNNSLHVAPSAT